MRQRQPACCWSSRHGGIGVVALGVLWSLAVAIGFAAAVVYEQTSAPEHEVLGHWPSRTMCAAPQGKPMLVVFIHPKCGCSRASLEEIRHLHRRCGEKLDMQFVFLDRGDAPWRSEDTAHWETVHEMNAGGAFVDINGIEHRRFGATTSGEVFLYLASGELAFHGGVTVGRGHSGPSPGRAAIEAIVLNSPATIRQTAVFGCPLESSCYATGRCAGHDEAPCHE